MGRTKSRPLGEALSNREKTKGTTSLSRPGCHTSALTSILNKPGGLPLPTSDLGPPFLCKSTYNTHTHYRSAQLVVKGFSFTTTPYLQNKQRVTALSNSVTRTNLLRNPKTTLDCIPVNNHTNPQRCLSPLGMFCPKTKTPKRKPSNSGSREFLDTEASEDNAPATSSPYLSTNLITREYC